MKRSLPLTYDEVVDEIARFTDLSQKEVEYRVWREALELGWNVAQDAARFRVVPHRYDDSMLRLYQEGSGFIFETMVFWARLDRQRWILTIPLPCPTSRDRPHSVASLSVVREYGATTSGRRSVKTRRRQEETPQKNLRAWRTSLTGCPAQGKSAGARS